MRASAVATILDFEQAGTWTGSEPSQDEKLARLSKHQNGDMATTASNERGFSSRPGNTAQAVDINSVRSLTSAESRPAAPAAPRLSLEPLQEWEGYVTAVGPARFSARLVDITAGKKIETERGQFLISELSDDNIPLLREGAKFRWVIGTQISHGGRKRCISEIVFRRLPAWTKRDLDNARLEAEELAAEHWD